MISNLLYAFGDPKANYGSAQQLAERLKNTIRSRKCRLIIVDETQHLIPGGKPSIALIDAILNTFKILDDTGVSFLLAGMETILQLWGSDEQIRSRFQTTYYLSNLEYPKDRREWFGITSKFQETMERYGVKVDCQDLGDRLYSATNGYMRPLVIILASAIVSATNRGRSIITMEDLRKASQKNIDELDGLPTAFDKDIATITRFNQEARRTLRLAPTEGNFASALKQ